MNKALRILSALTLLAALTACGGDSAEDHIARANQFIDAADYDSAVIELKNALQQRRDAAEARWLLGKVYLETGDVVSAAKELQRALDLGWSPDDTLPALARSLLAQRKNAEVLALQEKGLKPPAAGRLLASQALAAVAQGKIERAQRLADKALDKAPDSAEVQFAQARILAGRRDIAGAQTVMTDLLARDPDNGTAWELVGDLRMAQRQRQEALQAYNQAVSLQPSNFGALLKRAELSLLAGDYAAAQLDTTTLLRKAPQHPEVNYIQGLIHFQAERYGEAITALSVAEPAARQFPLLLFFLASAQLQEGHLDQAAVQAARFHQLAPRHIPGSKLLATINLQQGRYGDVQELLEPVLEIRPNDVGALILMSNALMRDGQADAAITMLSRVATLRPGSAVAQLSLGAGLMMGARGGDATEHLETALQLAPKFQQAEILLVMNHLQKREYEAAIEAAQRYRRRNLTSTTPLNLLGRAYLAAGQRDKARESFEQTLKLDAGDTGANQNLARMAAAGGDVAAARRYYATLLEHHADFLPALIQLARLDARAGNEESLQRHIEQAIEAHPDAIQPRLMLGRYYLRNGRPEKVAPLFVGLQEVQQRSPQVLRLIALAQLAAREPGEAQYTLGQLEAVAPETAALHHLMARAAARAGDAERAERELRRALELNEDYFPSRVALARIALANGQADQFAGHMEKLQARAPRNPDVLLLQAESARGKGDNATAVDLAELAFSRAPGTATLLALGSYKEAAGEQAEALKLYTDWLAEHPEDAAVRLTMANSLQVTRNVDKARMEYEQLLEIDPDNVAALNNLAWYSREENPVQALKYAQRASRLAPDSADVLDTLAVLEYINKDYKKAARSVERALAISPDNPSLLYHSAMIAAATGDDSTAIDVLEKLLGSGADFPEQDRANALLVALRK